jgi:hypothetical protein
MFIKRPWHFTIEMNNEMSRCFFSLVFNYFIYFLKNYPLILYLLGVGHHNLF